MLGYTAEDATEARAQATARGHRLGRFNRPSNSLTYEAPCTRCPAWAGIRHRQWWHAWDVRHIGPALTNACTGEDARH